MFKKHLPILTFIIALSWVAYFNSLTGGFIVDDIPAFLGNQNVKDLGYALVNYNPQTLLYALTYYLFGFSTVPQHIISVLLHTLNVTLAYFLLLKLSNKKTAIIATLLFALHPVNIESVTWMSGRSYLFNGVVFFATALLYIDYLKTASPKRLKQAYVAFGLLTLLIGNAWTSLTPILLFILQIAFTKVTKEKLKLIIPFFVMIGLYIIFTIGGGTLESRLSSIGSVASSDITQFDIRLFAFSIARPAELLIFPSALTLYHVPTTPLWMIITILIGISVAMVFAFKFSKEMFFLLLLIHISFSIALVPLFMTNSVAERYLYLATFFYALLISKLIVRIKLKYVSGVLTTVICVLFVLKIIDRNQNWQDSITFWNAEIRTNPTNARLYAELGYTYITEIKDYDLATKYIEKSIEIDPLQFFAHHNLGKIYTDKQEFDKAKPHFIQALELNRNFYLSWYGLAYLEYNKNNKAEALIYVNKVLEINPTYVKAIELRKAIEELPSN